MEQRLIAVAWPSENPLSSGAFVGQENNPRETLKIEN